MKAFPFLSHSRDLTVTVNWLSAPTTGTDDRCSGSQCNIWKFFNFAQTLNATRTRWWFLLFCFQEIVFVMKKKKYAPPPISHSIAVILTDIYVHRPWVMSSRVSVLNEKKFKFNLKWNNCSGCKLKLVLFYC